MSSRSGLFKDRNRTLVFADRISESMPVIGQVHRRIHQGTFFSCDQTESLGPFLTSGMRIVTSGVQNPKRTHLRWKVSNEGPVPLIFQIREDEQFMEPGFDCTPQNHDRESQVSPVTEVFSFAVGAFTGIPIQTLSIPVGYLGPDPSGEPTEWLLKSNTEYIVEVFNQSFIDAQIVGLTIEFYEDEDVPSGG